MSSDKNYIQSIDVVEGLESFVKNQFPIAESDTDINLAVAKEFVLEALYQSSYLSKFESNDQVTYKDLIGTIFNSLPEDDDEKDLNYFA
jgi:hypothetical protein